MGQLALEIGISRCIYLLKVELRKKNHHFNIRHIAKISKALDIEICDLLKEDNYR
jgi:hypothetical protein